MLPSHYCASYSQSHSITVYSLLSTQSRGRAQLTLSSIINRSYAVPTEILYILTRNEYGIFAASKSNGTPFIAKVRGEFGLQTNNLEILE